MKMHRDYRPIHAQLVAAGATVDVTGGGHLRYRLAGRGPLVLPSSPSDRRGLANARREVRRWLDGAR